MPRRVYGPAPTLLQLHRECRWTWLFCQRCKHHKPVTLVPFMILWGMDASSDRLRRSARCDRCGALGAALQHPSWTGQGSGFQSFADALELDQRVDGPETKKPSTSSDAEGG